MGKVCRVETLGLVDYEQAWEYQKRLAEEIARGERPPTLLLLEHPHTYTFGRRGQAANLLWDAAELQRRGVAVHWVDRGGDVTYHGPGQLVGYPLLPLVALGQVSPAVGSTPLDDHDPASQPVGSTPPGAIARLDYVGYLRRLEQVLIQALQALSVQAHAFPGQTGVWVTGSQWPVPAKIASIGVKVDARGVTQHGFALNVNPDMTYWQGIVACGLTGAPTACLADLLDPLPATEHVIQEVIRAFADIFGYHIVLAQAQ
jgi:lipoyl(octanoyl) transferase